MADTSLRSVVPPQRSTAHYVRRSAARNLPAVDSPCPRPVSPFQSTRTAIPSATERAHVTPIRHGSLRSHRVVTRNLPPVDSSLSRSLASASDTRPEYQRQLLWPGARSIARLGEGQVCLSEDKLVSKKHPAAKPPFHRTRGGAASSAVFPQVFARSGARSEPEAREDTRRSKKWGSKR